MVYRRLFTLLALVAGLSGLSPAASPAAQVCGRVVARLHVRDRQHLSAVAGQLDIWEAHPDERMAIVALTPAQIRWLQSLGYTVEVDPDKTALLDVQAAALDPRFHYFDDAYSNAYGRYVVAFLHDINARFPSLTELIDIGDAWMAGQPSAHSRDLLVLRISNEDPAYGPIETKPAFFLMAAIHAREVVVPELAIRYVRYLTEGYGGEGGYGLDPDVTWLVNHHLAYVLVMQNPDGHWVNEQDTRAYRRKNMDWDDGCGYASQWGVDLNRNHSFLWGCCGGSSGDPCSETYRGPSRASEPETQAFQGFYAAVMADRNGPNGDDEIPPAAPRDTPGLFVSLHSYGDLVLWPWGFSGYGRAPNDRDLQTIGRKLAYYNGYDPSGTIWYDVDGGSDDWTYGKFGNASFTLEVGPSSGACSGFFPPYDCLDGSAGRDFWAENRPALLYAHKIASAPYLTAHGPDAEATAAMPNRASPGEPVKLTATIADHRYAGDPLQPVFAAEYFLDAPGQDGSGAVMLPRDGNWGGLSEGAEATVDTSGLSTGQHVLLVHGQNGSGDWGPFSAAFLLISSAGAKSYSYLPLVWRAAGP